MCQTLQALLRAVRQNVGIITVILISNLHVLQTISPNFSPDFERGAVSVPGGLKVELEQDNEDEYACAQA